MDTLERIALGVVILGTLAWLGWLLASLPASLVPLLGSILLHGGRL